MRITPVALAMVCALLLAGCQNAADRPNSTSGMESPQARADARPMDVVTAEPTAELGTEPAPGIKAAEEPTVIVSPPIDPSPGVAVSRVIRPAEGIEVDPDNSVVRLAGRVCLDVGWLEQIACSPNSREHESLVLLPQPASLIHASLLMAGFEAGRPGGWSYDAQTKQFNFIQPLGSSLAIEFEYMRDGVLVREPVRRWIRDHLGRHSFPDEPWIFAGSVWEENNEWMRERTGQDEHYVADMTGSIIGLVTFGDEVIGYSKVISDDATLQPAEWEVDADHIPPIGTDVTIIISRWDNDGASANE